MQTLKQINLDELLSQKGSLAVGNSCELGGPSVLYTDEYVGTSDKHKFHACRFCDYAYSSSGHSYALCGGTGYKSPFELFKGITNLEVLNENTPTVPQ